MAVSALRQRFPQVAVTTVTADLTYRRARGDPGSPPKIDILVTNNAGPQPGVLADWHEEAPGAMAANFIPAVQLIRAPARDAAAALRAIVNITSAMVKAPHCYDVVIHLGADAR